MPLPVAGGGEGVLATPLSWRQGCRGRGQRNCTRMDPSPALGLRWGLTRLFFRGGDKTPFLTFSARGGKGEPATAVL